MSTFKQRKQLISDSSTTLILLEFRDSMTGTISRLVNDVVDWTINGVTYIGLPFNFKPPSDVTGETSKGSISIDNVGRGISELMETLNPLSRMYAKVIVTDSEDPTHVEIDYILPMSSVTINGVVATASVGVDFLMNQSAVKKRFDPITTPGVF